MAFYQLKTEFKRNNIKKVYNGTETLTFLRPRTWESVPEELKNFQEFKCENKTVESTKLSIQVMPQVGFS